MNDNSSMSFHTNPTHLELLLKAAQFLKSTMQVAPYLRLLSFLTTPQNDSISLRKLLNLQRMMPRRPSWKIYARLTGLNGLILFYLFVYDLYPLIISTMQAISTGSWTMETIHGIQIWSQKLMVSFITCVNLIFFLIFCYSETAGQPPLFNSQTSERK